MSRDSLRGPSIVWLLVCFFAAGCGSKPAPVASTPPKVSVQSPERRRLTDYAEYNGWIVADGSVDVRARVRGHIQKVNFKDGQLVSAGTVLFQLDPRPFQTEIDRATEQVKIYSAQRVAAVKEEARLRELLSKGGASLSQVEKAEADAQSLAAQIAAAHEEINRRTLDLGYAQVKAEIGGRVGDAKLQVGDLVNAGGSDPLLTTIVATDSVRVTFNIDEPTVMRFAQRAGAAGKNPTEVLANLKDAKFPVFFALDGESEFKQQGELRFGDNKIDSGTGTLPVYGVVDNKNGRLIVGSRVRVRIPVGEQYEALLVPETAILSDQTDRYVLVADADNVVSRRNVKTLRLTDDKMRSITPDPVNTSDPPEKWTVLVDNLQRARLNYPIDPQKPAATGARPPRS